MTAKAALCKVLLSGTVVNIRNIHELTGYTNAAREIGRNIERSSDNGFGVTVSRVKREDKNRFGVYCTWVDYRLTRTEMNKKGIEKMKAYVKANTK